MHGHMIDFKKRGSFIRLGWRAALGKPVPDYGYRPAHISWSRKGVELVISSLFAVCGTTLARRLVEWAPIELIGPLFNTLRKSWKELSKPVKRKGLASSEYMIESSGRIPQEGCTESDSPQSLPSTLGQK
jgi:coenzyme F420 hydrogenase subunit beta